MRRPALRDLALPLALAGMAAVERVAGRLDPESTPLYIALVATLVVPLAWVRVAPLGAVLGCLAGVQALTAVVGSGDGPMTALLALMVASYGGGSHPVARRAIYGGVALALGALSIPLVSRLSGSPLAADNVLFALVLGGIPWGGGWLNRRRRERAVELAELATELERARVEHARAAATAERARIAAELNDAVAHGVAELMVHAGAASRLLTNDPEAAAAALATVQARGRATLEELRRMLVVMRASSPASHPS